MIRTRHDARRRPLEGLVVLGLAVVMIIGIALAGWGGQIRDLLPYASCLISRDPGCAITAVLSPYQRALAGRYVALGDGLGCHRSASPYSLILSTDNPFAEGSELFACSGSAAGDPVDHDQQLAALSDQTSLITVSAGGSDLDFAGVLQDCGEDGAGALSTSCRGRHDRRIAHQLRELQSELITQDRVARALAPQARIVIVGLPPIFVEGPRAGYRDLLGTEDQAWMNEQAAELNATLAAVAAATGAEFVDPTEMFTGHQLGSDVPWFNNLTVTGPGAMVVDPTSFQPNTKGQTAYAKAIQRQLEDPT